jgi:hypothetical protein
MRHCNKRGFCLKIVDCGNAGIWHIAKNKKRPKKQLVTRFTESRWNANGDERQMTSVDTVNRNSHFLEIIMKTTRIALTVAATVTGLFSTAAFAQSVASEVERNINQQQRIEQGLQSGQLTTREASGLERKESRVERMEANAMKDGKLSDAEKNRINQAQNKVSQDIYREKHDAQRGDPNSASSQRMQGDVQRNINQQQRIEQGVKSGQLTPREAGRLEQGQSRANQMQARAGANGQISRGEQRNIQMSENRHSGQINREKHDGQQGQTNASGNAQNGNSRNSGNHNGGQQQNRGGQGGGAQRGGNGGNGGQHGGHGHR